MIRADKPGRTVNCDMCLRDYYEHKHNEQLCLSCFKDCFLTFKDLEDRYVYPLEDVHISEGRVKDSSKAL